MDETGNSLDGGIELPSGQKLFELAKQFLILKERLLRESQTDHEKYPTLSFMAKSLNITIEQCFELQDYAQNQLGEDEAEHIHSQAQQFLDGDGIPLGEQL